MLVNVILIPFLLGIIVNISKYSYFEPEYVYMLNQTKIEYGEFINSTELTSTIICQPLLKEDLRCYLNDIMVMISNYTNFNNRTTTTNLIQVGHWFHMKFNYRGLISMNTEIGAGEMIDNHLIPDVVHQFHVGIDTVIQAIYSGSTARENTQIGVCTTTYNMNMRYWMEDENEETDSNFQIKLLKNISDENDILLKDLQIVKNRKDCKYSKKFNDSFLNGGKVTKYVQKIEIIDNKLKMFTTLEGQRPLDPQNSSSETYMFTQITQLNLINIRSRKTISFEVTPYERSRF